MARTRAEQKLYELGYVDQNENEWYYIFRFKGAQVEFGNDD